MQLPHSSGLDLDEGRRDVLRGRKYAGIGDPYRSALGPDRLLGEHVMAEALRRRLGAHELVRTERAGDRRLEDIELTRIRRVSEQRRRHAEVLAQDLGRHVLEPVAEQKRAVLVEVAVVKDEEEFAAVGA